MVGSCFWVLNEEQTEIFQVPTLSAYLACLDPSLSALAYLVAWLPAAVACQLGRAITHQVIAQPAIRTSHRTLVLVWTAACLVSCLLAVVAY